ncbi:MAG: 30S ribosomal protein S2 [Alphaproteobacteria bacterium]|nr:30S ribosomal protein S2 [Alphaproteobacteria bacterium]
MTKIPNVSITEMLDAGVHFGHKASRWNPKMASYIYGIKDDVHIIDLQKTSSLMKEALKIVYETVKNNGKVLFIGTKVQASNLIAEYAEKCGQYYVNHRWLGGMLTNWPTIHKSIKRLEELEQVLEEEKKEPTRTKKELLEITRKCDKLCRSLGGIRSLNGKPDLIFIVDTNREHLAIQEAIKLNIPMIAVVDTNSNPDDIEYIIPGNDDAIRSIRLYCQLVSDAALMGIEDGLVQSGVDLGALSENSMHRGASKGVVKLQTSKKLDRTSSKIENSEEFIASLDQSSLTMINEK